MPKHKLAHAMVGILVMPGLIFAGYPDVPRSHWAAPAVDKVAQSGVMTSRSDGRFHGGNPATRYEVASAVARSMAELENRLVAEGHSPQDIVPYIERINLYVADEIDQLKQAQKELRATVNELLERMERREAHSTPLPPPAPPMAHPHHSVVPHTELRSRTEVHSDQRIHAVEGAAPVNQAPTAHQHTQAALTRIRSRVAEGKIGAVEGAAPVVKTEVEVSEEKTLRESFAKRAKQATTAHPAAEAATPVTPVHSIISDEAAWEKSGSPSTRDDVEEMKMEDSHDAVAADETRPDIDTTSTVEIAAPVKKTAKKTAKKTEKKATTKPMQTSKKPTPRAAPMPIGAAPKVDATHGALALPASAPSPFGAEEHDASPSYPAKPARQNLPKKAAAKAKAKVSYKEPAQAPITVATAATAVPMEASEILDAPDIAPGDGPSDEELSNWKPAASGATAQSASASPLAATTSNGPRQAVQRSARASTLLAELRNRVPAKH